MGNVIEMGKRWITNRDVATAVMSLESENKALHELIVEVLAVVQRNTSEMTVLKETVQLLTETALDIKDITSKGTRVADEIKHTKFYGQATKLLDSAIEKVAELTNKEIRKMIHRAASAHPSGRRKGYTHIYQKLSEVTGFDVYTHGKVTLKKSDGIEGWSKDASYINTILKHGKEKETAVICMQVLAD